MELPPLWLWVIKWKTQYKAYNTALWVTGQGGPRSAPSLSTEFVECFSQFTFTTFFEKKNCSFYHSEPLITSFLISVFFASVLLHKRIFCLRKHSCVLCKSITCEGSASHPLLSVFPESSFPREWLSCGFPRAYLLTLFLYHFIIIMLDICLRHSCED